MSMEITSVCAIYATCSANVLWNAIFSLISFLKSLCVCGGGGYVQIIH